MNRRMQGGWLGAVGLSLALGLSSWDRSGAQQTYQQTRTQEVVEAQKFVLRDQRGRVRAELGPTAGGDAVSLRLFDGRGRQRINVAVGDDGDLATVSVIDTAGEDRALMVVDPTGASIAVTQGDRVAGFSSENNGPTAFAAGQGGHDSFLLGIDADGQPMSRP